MKFINNDKLQEAVNNIGKTKSLREDINDDRATLLAEYLEVDPETIKQNDDIFETEDGEEYLVINENIVDLRVRDEIESFIDDVGFTGFTENFQEWIKSNALDEDWFRDALSENNYYYAEDIASESDDTYSNRLVRECVENGLISDDQLKENEDGLLEPIELSEGECVDMLSEYLTDNIDDAVEEFKFQFGDSEIDIMIKEHPGLLNIDAITEQAISWDGAGHFLASYDGEEIDLGNGYMAYRIN